MTNIFNVTNGKIEIYNMEPLVEDIKEFKAKEMLTIPISERVLIKEPTKGFLTTKKGVIYKCGSFILRKSKENEYERNINLVNDYIDGEFQEDRVVARYNGYDDFLYLLEAYYPLDEEQINLTKDLYLLFQLQNAEYSDYHLHDEDLSKIKDLFKISNKPDNIIDMNELIKTYYYIEQDEGKLEEKMEYLNDSTKIYNKIKNTIK